MGTTDELAQRCLVRIRDKALQIAPDEWTPVPDGFAWWPGPLRQTVTARPLAQDYDGVEVRIHTDIADLQRPVPPGRLAALQDLTTTSAFSAARTLRLNTSLIVHPELVHWQEQVLSWVAAVQVAEAADAYGEHLPGTTHLSGTPDVGRPFDEITDVRKLLRRESERLADIVQTADVLGRAADLAGGELADAPGVSNAVILTRPWTALVPEAAEAFGGAPVRTYLTAASHRQVGPGFGLRTPLPLAVDLETASAVAAVVNRGDDTRNWVHVGPWLPFEGSLFVSTFLPAGMGGTDGAAELLANIVSYHERMLQPALDLVVDRVSSANGIA